MTKIEEMVETFTKAADKYGRYGDDTGIRDGLLAVIEKHIGPLIEAAVEFGADRQREKPIFDAPVSLSGVPRAYRERILSALTKGNGRD